MMRVLVFFAVALALAACQKTSDLYGKGQLVLHPKVAELSQEIRGKGSVGYESVFMAVDKSSRYLGYTYCPGEPNSCIDSRGNIPGGTAVELCNKDGSYDCALYAINNSVVWQGPIYLRDSGNGQSVPYHGRWPFQIKHPSPSAGELIGNEGRLTLSSSELGQNCEVSLRPRGRVSGVIFASCDNGRTFSGEYARSSKGIIRGKGQRNDGSAYQFQLDTSQGKGSPGPGYFE
jgi:hypothetical protein